MLEFSQAVLIQLNLIHPKTNVDFIDMHFATDIDKDISWGAGKAEVNCHVSGTHFLCFKIPVLKW
jgi:hypothetical protein